MAMPQLRILVKTERENIDTRYQKNLRRLVSPMLIFTIIFYRIITNPSSSSNNIILQITELRRGRNVGCQRHWRQWQRRVLDIRDSAVTSA